MACFGAQAQITPGQVGDTLKKPIELQPVKPAPTVQTQPQEAPQAAAAGKTLTVEKFEFAGNTLFSGSELTALIKDYLNRPVTLLDIFEAADKVADFYVSKGYTLASVNVPPQKIEQGTVRLLVSEGRIARITAEDNKLYTTEQITDQLGDIRPGTVYQGSTLAERVRNLNTLPGLQAKAIVKPGERYGTSDLVIKTVEDPVSGSLIVDNFGRESIGEIRFSAFAQVNNPLKVGDQLQLLLLRSEDNLLRYGYAAYSLPVNYSGTRLNLSYGAAEFDVAGTGATVDGENRSMRATIDHPVLVTPNSRLSISLGASRTVANSDFGGITFSDTAINLAEIGANFSYNHANLAVTQAVLSVASNFDELERADLTPPLGERLNANQIFRGELDIQHLRPLVKGFQLYLHANGVFSPDPLSDITSFSLGGPNSIRGYPASEVRGDRGYFGTVAVNFPINFGGVRLVPRVFVDTGMVYVVDPGPADFDNKSLTSVGFGTDLQYQRISAKLDLAFPREERDASDDRDDGRLFGSLAVSF